MSLRDTLTPESKARYQVDYGLNYQLGHLAALDSISSLRGKRVLEIGGSNLPRSLVLGDLGAAQWIGTDYWDDVSDIDGYVSDRSSTKCSGLNAHYRTEKVLSSRGDTNAALALDYAILLGNIADLNISEHFDAVVSIAAFEHILKFGGMLDRAYDALKPGGVLLSAFSPIWPAPDGHHLWGLRDKVGNEYNFESSLIPPYGHLLMSPPQMRQHLLRTVDPETADEAIYKIYYLPDLNRLFFEDYIDYFKASKFRITNVLATGQRTIPDELQSRLEAACPGKHQFEPGLVYALAQK